jgi:hypothetical protein
VGVCAACGDLGELNCSVSLPPALENQAGLFKGVAREKQRNPSSGPFSDRYLIVFDSQSNFTKNNFDPSPVQISFAPNNRTTLALS